MLHYNYEKTTKQTNKRLSSFQHDFGWKFQIGVQICRSDYMLGPLLIDHETVLQYITTMSRWLKFQKNIEIANEIDKTWYPH